MKIKVHMKTPDAVHYAIKEAMESEPADAMADDRKAEAKEALGYWFNYGECLSVVFDTDLMTATVLPAK